MLIKPRARFLTSANNHGHRRLNVSDQTGLCVFSLKHLKVFIHQADRGLAVAGERQIGVLTCVVILSSITINPTHLLPANHFFFFPFFKKNFIQLWKEDVIVIDTYVAGQLYSPSQGTHTHTNFPLRCQFCTECKTADEKVSAWGFLTWAPLYS